MPNSVPAIPVDQFRVPLVNSKTIAAGLAQQKLPFVLDLSIDYEGSETDDDRPVGFLKKLGWTSTSSFATPASSSATGQYIETTQSAVAREVFRRCPLAASACWHALLTPDGLVGAYCRRNFSVVAEDGIDISSLAWSSTAAFRSSASDGESNISVVDDVGSLLLKSCTPPRHYATEDLAGGLEEALDYFYRDFEATNVPPEITHALLRRRAPALERERVEKSTSPPAPPPAVGVYLHGRVPTPQERGATASSSEVVGADEALLQDSVFESLRLNYPHIFGTEPYRVSLYASRHGMQTNLHCDQHSGFLVQIIGSKRVVLVGAGPPSDLAAKQARKALRCRHWGNLRAPVNRRSWHDDGLPDVPVADWARLANGGPFGPSSSGATIGLGQVAEVELRPGQALYIPKGVFHDVLSRGVDGLQSDETLGLVLRCFD